VEARLRPFAHIGDVRDWGSKLAGAIGRIVGIFHLVENCHHPAPWDLKIAPATTMRAMNLSDFLIEHALAAFAGMEEDPKLTDAQLVLKWIRSERRERFSSRDLHQALKGRTRYRYADSIEQPLAALCQSGYIRRVQFEDFEKRVRGRKPAFYAVNPATYQFEDFEAASLGVPGKKEVKKGHYSHVVPIDSLNPSQKPPQNPQIAMSLNSRGIGHEIQESVHSQNPRIPGEEG